MSKDFTVVVERDEQGFFVATVPAIPGCYAQARTRHELEARVREAIAACLEDNVEQLPSMEFIAVERVTVPS